MSYRCQVCKESFGVTERPTRTVLSTRRKEYPNSNKIGWEIVEEKMTCTPCSIRVGVQPPQSIVVDHVVEQPVVVTDDLVADYAE